MFGYEEDKTKSNTLKFGLNTDIEIKELSFNDEKKYLKLVIRHLNSEVQQRKYPIVSTYVNGQKITDPQHPEMVKKAKEFSAWFIHLLNSMQDKAVVKNVMDKQFTDFADFIKTGLTLIPEDLSERRFDVFLHYQWNRKPGFKIKFLTIPSNMNQGAWIIPATHKNWVSEITPKGMLRYKDEDGNIHPFTRSSWFMNSNFAKQDILEEGKKENIFEEGTEDKSLETKDDDFDLF